MWFNLDGSIGSSNVLLPLLLPLVVIIDEEGDEASVIIPAEAAEEEEEEDEGDEEKSFLNFLKGDFDFDLLGGCIDGGGASDDGRGGGWRAL